MPIVANAAELKIVQAVEAGEWADFAPPELLDVRATFLRALLLGKEIDYGEGLVRGITVRSPGLRVRGILIEGELDLSDCADLPPIFFEACVFGGVMNFSHARLAALSLTESQICAVLMQNARIDGVFDFSSVKPGGQGAEAPAWIDAHNCTIRGSVNGDGAILRVPPISGLYALRLSESDIAGGLYLRNRFQAIGGLSITGAQIHGGLHGQSAQLHARGDFALDASNAKIDGSLLLSDLATIGVAWLLGVRISGNCDLSSATVSRTLAFGTGDALVMDFAHIDGAMFMANNFTSNGCLSFVSISIGGNLQCNGARIINRSSDGNSSAFLLDNATITGALLMRHCFFAGRISLFGLTLGGNLECDGSQLNNITNDGAGNALSAEHARIGGSISLRAGFISEGRLFFADANIGGNFDCSAANFRNAMGETGGFTLNLQNAFIASNVLLRGIVNIGCVSFLGAKIGGFLEFLDAVLVGSKPFSSSPLPAESTVLATNLSVGGDVILNGVKVLGWLLFEHVEISGRLRWERLEFPAALKVVGPKAGDNNKLLDDLEFSYKNTPSPSEYIGCCRKFQHKKPLARIVLAHARIDAALQAYSISSEVPLLIDLSSAGVYTLDDDQSRGGEFENAAEFPSGWGVMGTDGNGDTLLDLDGFVYERVSYFRAARISVEAEKPWDWKDFATPRIEWLQRQYLSRENEFFPQPYRQLAKVMRDQGHLAAARAVTIAENDATPYGLFGPARRFFFGTCFGYGLSPWRASYTFCLVLLLGWGMVFWASKNGVLVMTPDREEAFVLELAPHAIVSSGPMKCKPDEIQPFFYALDMALPVVPLHEEDRCEIAEKRGTWWWQALWALYSIFGKAVTSLVLITYSGVLKPRD